MKVSKYLATVGLVLFFCLLASCSSAPTPNTLKLGVMEGPETELMEPVKAILKKQNVDLKVIAFSDYNMPNRALADGDIDANLFQHEPFLAGQVKSFNYRFAVIGPVFLYPMALYSDHIKELATLKKDDRVAIPNDFSNESRALQLLQQARLIRLRQADASTLQDIVENPLHLKIIELDAALLPHALSEVALAAINTNYAATIGLLPARDGLVVEPKQTRYANLLVVASKNVNDPKFIALYQALQAPSVRAKAQALFHGAAIPLFDQHRAEWSQNSGESHSISSLENAAKSVSPN